MKVMHTSLKLFSTITQCSNKSSLWKTHISQVIELFKLILVLPATNASSERSFSLLRLVKSYLRATTGQGWLNHLMILSAYKENIDPFLLSVFIKVQNVQAIQFLF